MILKEFIGKDTCNKNRVYAEVSCKVCNATFVRQKRFLSDVHTCSAKCLSVLKGSTIQITCAHCGTKSYRPKSKLNNSRSGLYFCDRICKEAAQRYNPLIQPDHYGTGNGKYNYRKRALEEKGERCNRCGYTSDSRALQVHHIDRNRENNSIDNLEVLCANCHSIEHTILGG